MESIIEFVRGLGKGLIVNSIYYVSVAVGAYAIYRLTRSCLSAQLKWAGVIGLSLLIFGFMFAVSAPSPAFLDFTKAYFLAGRDVWRGWEGLSQHYAGAYNFVNLPLVALVFAPFGVLGKWPAAFVYFALGLAVVLYVWRRATTTYQFSFTEKAFSLFLIAAYGPLVYSLREGNTSHILLAPLLIGILDLRARRDIRAGALFAAAAIIKPPLLILGVWAFLRGRWKVVAGGAGMLIGAGLASILLFGWDAHVFWYQEIVRPFAGSTLGAFNAQSIPSVFARIEAGPEAFFNFEPLTLGAVSRAIVVVITLALLAAAVWAAAPWKRVKQGADAIEGEVMLVLLLGLLVGGLSWSHYFVWALLPAAWVWAQTRGTAHATLTHRLLLAGFILAAPAVFESWRMILGGYGPFSWLLLSHVTWGALALFAACLLARRRLAA